MHRWSFNPKKIRIILPWVSHNMQCLNCYSYTKVPVYCSYCRWKAISVQPVWHALHSEISPPETWENPYWWVKDKWYNQHSQGLYLTFWSQVNHLVFFIFFASLLRWEAFSLWWVWYEVHPEVSHGETQEDTQWREALSMWLLSPGKLFLFAWKFGQQGIIWLQIRY